MGEIKNRAELVEVMATYLDVTPINIEMLLQALQNDGLAIVPVTPPEEMIAAGASEMPPLFSPYDDTHDAVAKIYRAMTAAAPFQHKEE